MDNEKIVEEIKSQLERNNVEYDYVKIHGRELAVKSSEPISAAAYGEIVRILMDSSKSGRIVIEDSGSGEVIRLPKWD